MDKYRKSAEEIMRRGDVIIARRKQRSAVIKRTAFAISGLCAAVIAGVGIWNNPRLHNLADKTPPKGNYITDTTENNENQPAVTTSTSQTSALTTAATENKIIITSQTTTTEIVIVVTDRPIENTIPVLTATTNTPHFTTSAAEINTTTNSAETVTTTASQSVDSSAPNTEQTATASQPDNSSTPNTMQTAPTSQPNNLPTSNTMQTAATSQPDNSSTSNTKQTAATLPPVNSSTSNTMQTAATSQPDNSSTSNTIQTTNTESTENETTTTTSKTEPDIIAPVDIVTNPDNQNEVTEITYNNTLYKNTYFHTSLEDNKYNNQQYLGIIFINEKSYGELILLFNFIDNKYDVLLFKPVDSYEYFYFFPEGFILGGDFNNFKSYPQTNCS